MCCWWEAACSSQPSYASLQASPLPAMPGISEAAGCQWSSNNTWGRRAQASTKSACTKYSYPNSGTHVCMCAPSLRSTMFTKCRLPAKFGAYAVMQFASHCQAAYDPHGQTSVLEALVRHAMHWCSTQLEALTPPLVSALNKQLTASCAFLISSSSRSRSSAAACSGDSALPPSRRVCWLLRRVRPVLPAFPCAWLGGEAFEGGEPVTAAPGGKLSDALRLGAL
eukprot:scaffold21811_cov17-Tisochrysis_lutea.AAC.1